MVQESRQYSILLRRNSHLTIYIYFPIMVVTVSLSMDWDVKDQHGLCKSFSPCDFNLWGLTKEEVCRSKPRIFYELEQQI